MIQSVENARYERAVDGWPFIRVDVDGEPARIFDAQKNINRGGVILHGPEEDPGRYEKDPLFKFILPIDPEAGISNPIIIEGTANDSRITKLARLLIGSVNDGSFKTGPVDRSLYE